jgi:quercetin dioxygenase-like cupin family protein
VRDVGSKEKDFIGNTMKKSIVAMMLLGNTVVLAQTEVTPPEPVMPSAIKWMSPAALPGVQNAWVLGAGDKAGPYLLRVKLAPGSRIPPHSHPEERNGTVLAGTVYLGFGSTFDESKAVAIPAGGVWVAPANVPHFLWVKDGDAVFQCGGMGPSATSFVKH